MGNDGPMSAPRIILDAGGTSNFEVWMVTRSGVDKRRRTRERARWDGDQAQIFQKVNRAAKRARTLSL